MVSFGTTSPDTEKDRRLYLEARLREVNCLDCTVTVLAKKNSAHQTSVQWSGSSVHDCPEFNRMDHQPGGRHLYAACPRLGESIERAVREGELEVGAEDGY